MEQTNDEDEKPRQFASLDILREQIEEEGKAAEERIFEGVDRELAAMPPYIAEFHRVSTMEEILDIFNQMLNDNEYLKSVDITELKKNLKDIKRMNDKVLKTDLWKSKQILNMYKLVKLYANIRTPEELQARLESAVRDDSISYRFNNIPHNVLVKYSKIFKNNNPSIWTRETAQKFGILVRKIKRDYDGSAGRTRRKHKRGSRKHKRCSRKHKRGSRKRKRGSRKRHSIWKF